MITVKQWVESEEDIKVAWVSGQDILQHVLKGDYDMSRHKDPSPSMEHLETLQDGLEKRAKLKDGFDSIVENAYRPSRKWTRVSDTSGEVDIDRYVNGQRECFDSYRRQYRQGKAISIFIDCGIDYMMRYGKEMQERQEEAYTIAARAMSSKRPIRIIGIFCTKYREGRTVFAVIVKDYLDPIFPGIWGALGNNETVNSMRNCIADFVTGTCDTFNGGPFEMKLSDWILTENEEVIILNKGGSNYVKY